VKPYRQELEAEARATVRFETAPGKQMQIDFGARLVEIGGNRVRTYLFAATLGYSRRHHVRADNTKENGRASGRAGAAVSGFFA
jgi:transposase